MYLALGILARAQERGAFAGIAISSWTFFHPRGRRVARERGGKNRIVQFVGPAALTPQAQPVIHQKLTDPSNVKYPSNPATIPRRSNPFSAVSWPMEFLRVFCTQPRTLSSRTVHLEKDTRYFSCQKTCARCNREGLFAAMEFRRFGVIGGIILARGNLGYFAFRVIFGTVGLSLGNVVRKEPQRWMLLRSRNHRFNHRFTTKVN